MLTITEALQEIKTINSRAVKKREAIAKYVVRDARIRDPFEAAGGSEKWIRQERQSLLDLENRVIAIRTGIQRSNLSLSVTVQGETKTVAEWLTWRREIAQEQKKFAGFIASSIQALRQQLQQKGGRMTVGSSATATVNLMEKDAAPEMILSVDEMQNLQDIEHMETVLGDLDGKLSLFNATTTIEI
jgi:hypothetical protein